MKDQFTFNLNKILNVMTLWMLSTLILFFISPVKYNVTNKWTLILLVMIYIFSFYYGGRIGIRKRKRKCSSPVEINLLKSNLRFLRFCIVFALVFTIARMIFLLSSYGFGSIVDGLVAAFGDLSGAYNEKMTQTSNWIINYLTILCSPFYVYALVAGIFNFKKLSAPYKCLYIGYVLIDLSRWIIQGTNKGLFDLLGLVLFYYLIQRSRKEKRPFSNKRLFGTIIVVALIVLAVMFFYGTISSRLGNSYFNLQDQGVKYVDNDSLIFRILPPKISYTIIKLIGYITHGYYGMSLALRLEWIPMFGVGNSIFLTSFFDQLLNTKMIDYSFLTRVENSFGWSASIKWHTMYTYYANDVSFWGVPIIMFIVGYILMTSLHDYYTRNDMACLSLAYILVMSLLYSSANNQFLGSSNYIVAVVVFLLIYIFKDKVRVVWKK